MRKQKGMDELSKQGTGSGGSIGMLALLHQIVGTRSNTIKVALDTFFEGKSSS